MTRGKGGGPKTAAGKAITRLNAVKHGLTALSPVVSEFESEEEWEEFASAMMADLQPEGAMQAETAARIAQLSWRLRRVTRAEAAEARSNYYTTIDDFKVYILTHPHEEFGPEPTPQQAELLERMKARRALPSQAAMEKIAKEEAHLSRQLHRALWEMRLLKDDKRKEREESRGTWVEVRK